MNKTDRKVYCAYCGIKLAETRDHIPPKGIFNKPRTHDLITVPACSTCNHGFSSDDELFKVYMGFHAARSSANGEKLFKKGAVPTLKRKKGLIGKIMGTSQKVVVEGREYYQVQWDSDLYDRLVERIARGLFFHHFCRKVPEYCQIEVTWQPRFPDSDIFKETDMFSIAHGDFKYSFAKNEDSNFSIWVFEFYQSLWATAAIVEPD